MGVLDLPLNRRLLADLSARIDGRLLPLQRYAVEQTGLLAGESLLVSAPTASGKTLLAELAAIRALELSRTVLYLVPTRALAAEKARDLARWLTPHGIRVAQSTRDHREEDAAIVAGRVGVAVAVYEKAAALLARDSGMLVRAGLIVCDEVQMLGEPRRGGVIDLLLARWKTAPAATRPQLLALSAVLARPEVLAAWLGVRLVRWDARPFPLREGLLDARSGVFRWREASSGAEGEEILLEEGVASAGMPGVLVALAESCAPLLVFCATRREAVELARQAALARGICKHASRALDSLADLAPTQVRALLEELFPKRVGVHTGDLTEEQRLAVEDAFAHGDLDILVATPTLEQGVNLRAATVVHSPRMIGEDPLTGAPIAVPLARMRYRNQAGRAGRAADLPGRSILVVEGEFEADQARRSLLAAGLEEIASPLSSADWLAAAAGWVVGRAAPTAAHLEGLFAATFALHGAPPDAVRHRAGEALAEGARWGYWIVDGMGRVRVLPPGEAAAATGLLPATLAEWGHWLAEAEAAPEPLAALFLLLLAEEAGPECPAVDRAAWRRNIWTSRLSGMLAGRDPLARRLRGELADRHGVPQRWHAAARGALLLVDWCGGEGLVEMEEAHGLAAGRIERLARIASWLASGAATACGCLGRPVAVVDAFEDLARQLACPARSTSPAVEMAAPSAPGTAPLSLEFPENDVGAVYYGDKAIRLAPTPYKLLRLLAEHGGRAVSYADIYENVWPGVSVEQRQISHHRAVIEKRFGVAPGTLIETHARWGLALRIGDRPAS